MSFLVLAGTVVVLLLGVGHAVFTLQTTPTSGPMAPTDPRISEAMLIESGLGLAPDIRTTLWKAWVGFNLSHSLGIVTSALFIGIPTLLDFDAALDTTWWVVMALIIPLIYLALSIRFWFRDPTVGITIATVLIVGGIVGGLVT